MTIEEIRTKAGSISSYIWYIFLLFCWYFLDNIYTSMSPIIPGSSIEPLLEWGVRIMIVPFLFAGVIGGIDEQQRTQEEWDIGRFFSGGKTHYWRITGANLLAFVFITIVTIAALALGGIKQPNFEDNKPLLAIISIPYSMITLFWFVAIVAERKVFRGLLHSVKTLLTNPFALIIGIAWGVISFADTVGFDFRGGQTPLVLNGIRAAVIAVARVLAIVYALAVYKQTWGEALNKSTEEMLPTDSSSTEAGDGLVKASFGFTFVSFLPFFHLVALLLGFIAIKRKKRFVTRAAIACCVGGFFTIFYSLLVIGWLISRSIPSNDPAYSFLSDANADLKPQVALLEQGSFQEVQQQLEQSSANSSKHHWAFDCALALAKLQVHDLDGALEDFRIAAEKKPERGEFYYFYGLALLKNGQEKMAAEQFRIALMREPKLEDAERYLNLINTAYSPSRLISSLLFVIILLILFTLHEYGHAFAAWKLGDDTAEKQGRLTLNPLPHLDIFGSLILPAILLWQQSEFIFGWAKPVPVNPANFKDPQRDHMRVSFAGPAVNLIVSMACFVILGGILLFVRLFWPQALSLNFAAPFSAVSLVGPPFARWLTIFVVFLKQLFYTSLVLGCFNLFPVPPLDGSWILSGLLPQGLRNPFEKIRKYGFVIFLLLVMTPVLDYFLMIPVSAAWGGLELLVSAMGFG